MTSELPRTGEDVPRRVGDYVLGARVGEGGMGVVHRSRMPDGRDVAIKVLRPHIAHDDQARARLRREVSTLQRVHHPRVAAFFDADADGPAPFLVTEFVPGAPLDTVVAETGPLGPDALVRLGRGLSEALGAIHAVGIVHRDLKPGNVLMVGEDPVVIDFGIAQVAEDVRLTMTGMVMGTPGYLSPEVVEGGSVTEATDWWGWAATLAFAASGEPPFGRGPMSVVLDRVIRGRTRLAGVDPGLRPLLLAALDPDPTRRPHSAEVMAALEAYAAHRPVAAALNGVPVPRAAGATAAGGAGRGWADLDREWAQEHDGDVTRVQPAADHTRVQPVPPTPGTSVLPELPPPDGQPAQERAPRPMPASFDQQPVDYRADPSRPVTSRGWPQQQPGPRSPYPPPGRQSPAAYDSGGGSYPPAPRPDAGATAYPVRGGDPRIGRPSRTGTLAALLVLVVGVSTLVPLVAWGALAVWSVLSRWVDRAMTGLVLRRYEAGPRGTDVPMTMLATPWHLLTSVLAAGLSLILPLALALVTAAVTAFGVSQTMAVEMAVADPVPVGAGTLMGLVISWWGPGRVSLRRGSRTIVRGVVPPGVVTQIVVALVVAGGLALGTWAVLEAQEVRAWPLTTTPGLPAIEPLLPLVP